MAKRKKVSEEINSNSWITTFTNLIILLLAFFIVLVNMGVQDQNKKQLALNSLFGTFGLKAGGQAAIGSPSGSDFTVHESPMIEEDIDYERLRNIALANDLVSDVDIKREIDKNVITIKNRVLFDKGSFEIQEEAIQYLTEIAPVLKEGPGIIELRGYVDRAETLLEPDPQNASLNLSTKRVLAILHFFENECLIPKSRLVAHGFGIAEGDGKGSLNKRKLNSQVEIIVDSRQKIPYLSRVKESGGLLDFKGFFFKMLRDQ